MTLFHREKDYDYFQCFIEVSELAKEEALFLEKLMTSFQFTEVELRLKEMHELENRADIRKHELCSHLAKEFITPIEREDISLLAQNLDNIVDSIEDVLRKIYMYNISEIRHEAIEFSRLVTSCCSSFARLLQEFSDFKHSDKIHNYIIEINTIENQGDRLHALSIHRLFTEHQEPWKQLAWNMIFEGFEAILDSCENAADIIEDIITKNT